MRACLRPARTVKSARAEAAPARPPALLPLARALAHQRLQLGDRPLDLRLPRAARRDPAVGVLQLAARRPQLAPPPRGDPRGAAPLGPSAPQPQREAGQPGRLCGLGAETQRTR